ncbi:MAG: alpha-glucan family phosphorylase, partial [Acidimicrobiia bacterium]
MEFGLDESFPIYAGGLGVLAGDFIKSARDLALPVVAVGLRWERGYCVQRIGPDGQPFDEFPDYDHSFLRDTGVRVRVRVRDSEVACAVWVTDRFGHVPLYL